MFFIAQMLDQLLYEASAFNLGVYLACAMLLTVVVLAAMILPASQASLLNPTEALRSE